MHAEISAYPKKQPVSGVRVKTAGFGPLDGSCPFLPAVADWKSRDYHAGVAGSFRSVELHSPKNQTFSSASSSNYRLVEAYCERPRPEYHPSEKKNKPSQVQENKQTRAPLHN